MNTSFLVQGMEAIKALFERLLHGVEQAGNARAVVGTNVRYARFLEEGTKFMHARPYLVPALEHQQGDITQRVEHAMTQLAGGAAASVLVDALHASGLAVQAEAQRNVAVRTGNLRRSLFTATFR